MNLLLRGLHSDDNDSDHHDRNSNHTIADVPNVPNVPNVHNVHHITSPAVSQAVFLAERMARLAATSASQASDLPSVVNASSRICADDDHAAGDKRDDNDDRDDDRDDEDDGDVTCNDNNDNDNDDDDDGLDLILSMLDNDDSEIALAHALAKPSPSVTTSLPDYPHSSNPLTTSVSVSVSTATATPAVIPHCAKLAHVIRRPQTTEPSVVANRQSSRSATPPSDAEIDEIAEIVPICNTRDIIRGRHRGRRNDGIDELQQQQQQQQYHHHEAVVDDDHDDIDDDNDNDDVDDDDGYYVHPRLKCASRKAWTYREDSVVADVFTSVCPDRQRAELARRVPGRLWQEAQSRFQSICMTGWQQPAATATGTSTAASPAAAVSQQQQLSSSSCPIERGVALAMGFGRRVVEWRANHRNARKLVKPKCIIRKALPSFR